MVRKQVFFRASDTLINGLQSWADEGDEYKNRSDLIEQICERALSQHILDKAADEAQKRALIRLKQISKRTGLSITAVLEQVDRKI